MASGKRSNGEGTIFYDQTRQRWVASLVVGWRDGKPIRRKRLATSRAKATAKLRELRSETQQVPAARTMTVAQWMRYYLDEVAARKLKPSTLQGYNSTNDRYITPLLGHHRLDRLAPEHVEQAWDELMEVGNPVKVDPRPLTSTTALQTHAILRRALTIAVRRGHIPRNVCSLIDAPSVADTDVEPLSRGEAQRVLETARGRRNATRWSVALAIGLRQGEALGLTWHEDPDDPGDIDLDAGTLTVQHALQRIKGRGLVLVSTKSRASKRTLSLPAPLVAELRAHRAEQNAERLKAGTIWHDGPSYVFAQADGRPIDPKQDWEDWRDLLRDADVRHRRLHDARHTAGTLLLLQGIDRRVVMGVLGHSQISVTLRYQHVVDELQQEAAARMGAALWGETGG